MKEGKHGLRNADEEKLESILSVQRGFVNPFALMNSSAANVKFLMDSKIQTNQLIMIHPMCNDKTIEISTQDLIKTLEKTPEFIDFEALAVANSNANEEPVKQDKKNAKAKQPKDNKKDNKFKKEDEGELIGITSKREENFPDW
mmetsp:Transcript_55995/g.121830  ORF Transcript_55995/g.121830 Transcript_55995/m.121830 type:complete len:144 (-) Transcript_55995:1579-2010(-)